MVPKQVKGKRLEVIIAVNTVSAYVKKEGESKNKFTYALSRSLELEKTKEFLKEHDEKYKKFGEEANVKLRDFKTDHASVDENKDIRKDEKGEFKFTPENQKKIDKEADRLNSELNKAIEKFLEDEVEFEIYEYKGNVEELKLDEAFLKSIKLFLPEVKEVQLETV